ncbi:hypothetical protein DGG96_11585 [Legionella qingyii]|uniref:Uncharacterized protein n=1 Tax=Legionella qingyii TaxID=2184757 RepID=A0A317TZM1_9GAMM|nr:hypothetical protein [Legionella qingyii]PWY54539.1 hypothetical protein DGG96_16145 [Legionella qingyii]PWY55561.1 hypothetical protein DGG96_11585 [Legionella qingyii]RUR21431.1 hypothetical protein ELY20_12045 [Legionella qingyii]RUR24750.1 hypothetical protein ELY16_11275 [Legionella qingyii]
MVDITNSQDPEPVGSNNTQKNSTQMIMQVLTNDAKSTAPIPDFINRLKRLNLGTDQHMISLISDHPDYGNRLISLFKVLKEAKVFITNDLELIISKNINSVGGAVNLFGLIKELDIDPHVLSLDRLFKAARFDSNVAQSARELHQLGVLDLDTFELLLTYPGQSLDITRLIINLQEHAYNASSLVEKLRDSSISANHMSIALDLLNLMLENNSYYSNAINILLRQEQYINKIYEGAKKLVAEHYPLCTYFELVEENPQNANIFAKNILLLTNASLIDRDNLDDLLMVSKLGVGAYHFMKHLQLAGMLNAGNMQRICQPNNILNQNEIIGKLSNLPLIARFESEELERMLELVSKAASSGTDIQLFNEIIETHLIPCAGCSHPGLP